MQQPVCFHQSEEGEKVLFSLLVLLLLLFLPLLPFLFFSFSFYFYLLRLYPLRLAVFYHYQIMGLPSGGCSPSFISWARSWSIRHLEEEALSLFWAAQGPCWRCRSIMRTSFTVTRTTTLLLLVVIFVLLEGVIDSRCSFVGCRLWIDLLWHRN